MPFVHDQVLGLENNIPHQIRFDYDPGQVCPSVACPLSHLLVKSSSLRGFICGRRGILVFVRSTMV